MLDRCAVLLRLAEDLERSRDQLVRETRLTLVALAPTDVDAAERLSRGPAGGRSSCDSSPTAKRRCRAGRRAGRPVCSRAHSAAACALWPERLSADPARPCRDRP